MKMSQRQKLRFFSISFMIAGAAVSCATSNSSISSKNESISLTATDRIQPNVTSAKEIETTFGQPTVKIPLQSTHSESWLYCDRAQCVHGKLTIQIDTDSRAVKTISWTPSPGDAEQNLSVALAHYPEAAMKQQRLLLNYGHYVLTRENYTDAARGISISVDPDRKTVTQIFRSAPFRNIDGEQTATGFPKISILPDRGTASNQ